MDGDTVITFDSVWKKFRRGERHDSLRDLIPAAVKRLVGRRSGPELRDQEFWALQDVSFVVKRGEAVGIIGPNGAGKSTALKLLTRIMKPTRGRCQVIGRVGALIEVASGFHPDLTGRENVFLQGAIMGMPQVDVARRFADIVSFSGIEPFIDTPVKRYSSGMQARLGFAIAAHMDPDVLFVDEVLSVGDISFQSRCIEKMQDHVRRGTTLVFVSHNLQAVAALCRRCIVLAGGAKLHDGDAEEGLAVYLQAGQNFSSRHGATDHAFRLRSATLTRLRPNATGPLEPHEPCRLSVVLDCLRDSPPVNIGFELERTRDLFYAYGATSEELGHPLRACHTGDVLALEIDFIAHLARGHYRVNINVRDPRAGRFMCFAENAATFTVEEHVTFDGVVDLELAMRFLEKNDVAARSPIELPVGPV
jgi:lipopolysaccharide transport system ATP-binding protein